MTLLPANLRMGTVSGAVPLFPTVVTLLRLGTVGNLMSWLSAPSAHLWLRAVRGTMAQLPTIVATFRFRTVRSHVAFLSAIPALVITSSTSRRAFPSHMAF